MRTPKWGLVAFASTLLVGAACSLNPQPLPPDTFEDGGTTGDASAGMPDHDAGGGLTSDASSDTSPLPPPNDAGMLRDGETDANEAGDASDASDAGDAPSDAPDDVVGE